MYEKNEKGRHLPSALHKSAARPARHRQAPAPAARLRYGFAAVCAALAPLLCPAPAQAGDDYDALILRARAPATTNRRWPCCALLGPAGGPRAIQDRILVASWAGRPDEVTQAYAHRPPARSRPPTFGWRWRARCATCAAGRKRWRSSATACAPIRPSPPSPPASP